MLRLKGVSLKFESSKEETPHFISVDVGTKASESGCRREGTLNTTFRNTDDSKTDKSLRAAVQPRARRQASASFADLRYSMEYRVKGDQFHHNTNRPNHHNNSASVKYFWLDHEV
ncbi:hypothetical protein ElyMa_000766100 [Elysia marginata]|uniref:Uncharacterized protein n=1 Tax=Elysia marginata TaxID=1093978 RepID=A0AAV4GR32_9GAST|nr:hypothetical protein ElyMa_000766100 [Elysia marginata]